jgi:hypothetical protein
MAFPLHRLVKRAIDGGFGVKSQLNMDYCGQFLFTILNHQSCLKLASLTRSTSSPYLELSGSIHIERIPFCSLVLKAYLIMLRGEYTARPNYKQLRKRSPIHQ